MRLFSLAAATCALLGGGCLANAEYPVADESLDLVRASFRSVKIDSFDATLPDVDTIGYEFDLDATAGAQGRFKLAGKLTETFVTTRPLAELTLDYWPKGASLRSAKIGSRTVPFEIDAAAGKVTFRLGRTIAKGRAFSIVIELEATPQPLVSGAANSGLTFDADHALFTAHWPNRAKQWYPVRDNPRDAAMVAVVVRTPAEFEALSNGTRVTRKLADGRNETTQELLAPIPSYGFFLGISKAWVATRAALPGGRPFETYLHSRRANATSNLAVGPAALAYFENTFGPYRYPALRYVDVPTTWNSGGMEHPSVIAMDPSDLLTPVARTTAIHELAHHWSGNLVRIARWNDFWLSEGITEYLTRRFVEQNDGVAAAELLWQASIAGGRQARHALRPSGELETAPSPDSIMNAIFDNVAYDKGCWVLRVLERKVGRDRFTAFLRKWFETRAFQAATTEEFEALLEAETKQDFSEIFRRSVFGTENPE